MLSKVKSCSLMGIDGYVVQVETDISNGIPAFEIVGLGDAAVKESKERVRSAIKNSGMEFPTKRITINLAPANVRKEGSAFDVAIAIGLLKATGQIKDVNTDGFMFVGELSLDGEVRPVKGVLSMAICAMQSGIENIVLPEENADEASVVRGVKVLPVKGIEDIVNHLNDEEYIEPYYTDADRLFNNYTENEIDFSDVKGQGNVKRALEVAAAGGHNCIMLGYKRKVLKIQ